MSKTKEKVSRRNSDLKETRFLTIDNLAIPEHGMEQIFQVLRASLAIDTSSIGRWLDLRAFLLHIP